MVTDFGFNMLSAAEGLPEDVMQDSSACVSHLVQLRLKDSIPCDAVLNATLELVRKNVRRSKKSEPVASFLKEKQFQHSLLPVRR